MTNLPDEKLIEEFRKIGTYHDGDFLPFANISCKRGTVETVGGFRYAFDNFPEREYMLWCLKKEAENQAILENLAEISRKLDSLKNLNSVSNQPGVKKTFRLEFETVYRSIEDGSFFDKFYDTVSIYNRHVILNDVRFTEYCPVNHDSCKFEISIELSESVISDELLKKSLKTFIESVKTIAKNYILNYEKVRKRGTK